MWTKGVMCLQKRIMPVPAEIHSGFCIFASTFLIVYGAYHPQSLG